MRWSLVIPSLIGGLYAVCVFGAMTATWSGIGFGWACAVGIVGWGIPGVVVLANFLDRGEHRPPVTEPTPAAHHFADSRDEG